MKEKKITMKVCRGEKSNGESVIVNYKKKVKILVLGWSAEGDEVLQP
jgi:hypothetical protein